MRRYTSQSKREYVVYQGKDDARKHRESAGLWFFVPTKLFGKNAAFNTAFYTAAEAEEAIEEYDASFRRKEATFNKYLSEFEARERRQTFRLVS